ALNTLLLYFQQLPEPLIQYRFYNDLIGLAKECQRVIADEADKPLSAQKGEKGVPSVQMSRIILRIKDLLRQLPTANYRSLRHLIAHLNRYELELKHRLWYVAVFMITLARKLPHNTQREIQTSLKLRRNS
ncbi:hypothetical protein GOODEAATRI_010145, partial [Goodea atripinnis]